MACGVALAVGTLLPRTGAAKLAAWSV